MKKYLIPLAALSLLATAPVLAMEGGAPGNAGARQGSTLAAAEGGAVMQRDQGQTLAYVDPSAPRLILADSEGGGDLNPHVNGQPQQA